jgi:predicted NUDIX family NTP pyrophosphohydrolase
MAKERTRAASADASGSPRSAGLLVYRRREGAGVEFLLVHPGGPFWARRDDGAWSIPKGLIDPDEDALVAARREFEEETGLRVDGPFSPLSPLRQAGGKWVLSWLVEADLDLAGFRSNVFELAWPRGSGRIQQFPECDRAAYFDVAAAQRKILASQKPLIAEAAAHIRYKAGA